MRQEENELLFIKHCRNLQQLSLQQLHAIKEEKIDIINELAIQKQIIIDGIVALQEKFNIEQCELGDKASMKELLQKIADSENESQQIVRERCTSISKEMLANRKELNIQQAYEDRPYQEHGNMLNIIK
ncbi:protein FliT [Pelosinus fermentans]|uniref:flagellar protein FliT n=1 Tax=Pelosinus fermentans TaxID=365349 RepID=UPI0002685EA9|nr:flagellar protein FliT [Pelosinus fermentans]OAM92852.1 hypothetical protein FR7_00868 [Pelosinus fermentans DSM 17108]SDQ58928.1 protein FliT [Pelosinus fermentans]